MIGDALDDVRPDGWLVADIPARLEEVSDAWAEAPPATDLRDAIAAIGESG